VRVRFYYADNSFWQIDEQRAHWSPDDNELLQRGCHFRLATGGKWVFAGGGSHGTTPYGSVYTDLANAWNQHLANLIVGAGEESLEPDLAIDDRGAGRWGARNFLRKSCTSVGTDYGTPGIWVPF